MNSGRAYPRFLRALETLGTIPDGAAIGLALSGGPDSLALATLWSEFRDRRRPDLELSVGHVNHGLRGGDSEADEAFCREWASARGVPFWSRRVDVSARVAPGASWETAAREARLESFARWAEEHDLWAVATGHTADDQVETVLGNILRGTGISGLSGIPVQRPLAGCEARLIRPLLGFRREELEECLTRRGLEARVDASNDDLRFRRNRLRLELLPLLESKFNPRVRRALLGLAREAAELGHWRQTWLDEARRGVHLGPGVGALSLEALGTGRGEPAVTGPLLDVLWRGVTGGSSGLNRDHHEAWNRLVSPRPGRGGGYDLPRGWRLERAARWIFLRSTAATAPAAGPIPLQIPGETQIWWGLRLVVSPAGESERGWRVSRQTLAGATVRPRRADDRIASAVGHLSVPELLRARGIPRDLRQGFPVVTVPDPTGSGEPIWVPGIRGRPAEGGADGESWVVHATIETGEEERDPEAFLLARLLDPDR